MKQRKGKIKFRRILRALTALALLCGFVFLFIAAIKVRDKASCKAIKIDFTGKGDEFYIDKSDIRTLVVHNKTSNPIGKAISTIDTRQVEKTVMTNQWVKDAAVYFDNEETLHIKITQRQPVARVFTTDGSSFYIDDEGKKVPAIARFSARVPVFTNYPSATARKDSADSILYQQVIDMSHFLQQDSFWAAQVQQVNITADREFNIIPTVGDQLIAFGDGTNIEAKFDKLLAFYKHALSKIGWERYSIINVAYDNEIVCTKRDTNAEQLPVTKVTLQNDLTGTAQTASAE